jgi:hypothetical protein
MTEPTATEATQPSTTGYCPACGRGDAAPTADDWEQQRQRAETAETRLRLAHEARRGKEHQLDDVRRALCDIGFMDDDDPYSHADLADVIRQNGQALREGSWRAEDHAEHGSPCEQQPDGTCGAPDAAAKVDLPTNKPQTEEQ